MRDHAKNASDNDMSGGAPRPGSVNGDSTLATGDTTLVTLALADGTTGTLTTGAVTGFAAEGADTNEACGTPGEPGPATRVDGVLASEVSADAERADSDAVVADSDALVTADTGLTATDAGLTVRELRLR